MKNNQISLPSESGRRVTELADEYVTAYFRRFPELATHYGMPDAQHHKLTDNSFDGIQAWQSVEDSIFVWLKAIDERSLWGHPEWATYRVLFELLESAREMRCCRMELWPVRQMQGWQTDYPFLATKQPVDSSIRRDQALARWHALPHYIDTEISMIREGIRLGYSTPKRNVGLVISQLDNLLSMPIAKSPFFSPAERADDAQFQDDWQTLIKNDIYPAMQRYRAFLQKEYLEKARDEIAISANPGGEENYQAVLRYNTTLGHSPDEMYEIGLRSVQEQEQAIMHIGGQMYGTQDLGEIEKRLFLDQQADRFKSREEILTTARDLLDQVKEILPNWFDLLPETDVIIEPLQEFQEKDDFSQYHMAPEDGSRPAIFYINLNHAEQENRGTLDYLVFHETYPGHHLQIALAQEQRQVHTIAQLIGNIGFIEGWARYSEKLADEMGLYSSGFSRLEMLSAVPTGMVVDPGIHAMGWTRQQAIEYTLEKQSSLSNELAASYVDRIVIMPGQMTTYGVGEIEFRALRKQAERTLGNRFDIREFHSRLLENGSIPLSALRIVIEKWIAESQATKLENEQ